VVALDDNVRTTETDAAAAAVDESATDVPAQIIIAMAIGSADFRSLIKLVQNILTPSPCDRIVATTPSEAGWRAHRLGEASVKCMGTDPQ
jgi:hypothetical protein